ncbi:hypothetical protein LCGC14_1202550 [marine sediment metagenome]|uniref:Uncharacterized protein n=1 Tax=marine sediment metagenome TaxID=412755 RepID=A0A0F9LKX7_9ZZZZ
MSNSLKMGDYVNIIIGVILFFVISYVFGFVLELIIPSLSGMTLGQLITGGQREFIGIDPPVSAVVVMVVIFVAVFYNVYRGNK